VPLLHWLLAWHSHSANRCHACTVREAHLEATGCQTVMHGRHGEVSCMPMLHTEITAGVGV
jgi:hypothetical protein